MIESFEVEDLAVVLCGLSDDATPEDIDTALAEQFSIGFDDFFKLTTKLMKYTMPAKTAISDKWCRGFVNGDFFIMKEYIDE